MNAIYRLNSNPTTFDFATWVVIAKNSGCNSVSFLTEGGMDTRKYDVLTGWRRFGNILAPLCKLGGLGFEVVDSAEGMEFPYTWGDVERLYKKNGSLRLLRPTHEVRKPPYVTITMRKSFRNVHRNSDELAWEKFRGYLERRGKRVITINEAERAPTALEDRLAIYAGAEMNFGVNNGPMSMCAVSEAPYMIFNIIPKHKPVQPTYDLAAMMKYMDFDVGSQFSFRTPWQKLVWEPDDYEVMVNHYEMMFDERKAA